MIMYNKYLIELKIKPGYDGFMYNVQVVTVQKSILRIYSMS